MKKLTRLKIFVIVLGLLLIWTYAVAPAVGAANPLKDIGKNAANTVTKFLKSGEITKAHEAIEKAFQKFKEHPVKYGIKAVDTAGTVGAAGVGMSMIIEVVNNGVTTTYEPVFIRNDDHQRLDIYVEGERVGAIAYENLANLEEDEVNTQIKIAANNAITEYQARHESGT